MLSIKRTFTASHAAVELIRAFRRDGLSVRPISEASSWPARGTTDDMAVVSCYEPGVRPVYLVVHQSGACFTYDGKKVHRKKSDEPVLAACASAEATLNKLGRFLVSERRANGLFGGSQLTDDQFIDLIATVSATAQKLRKTRRTIEEQEARARNEQERRAQPKHRRRPFWPFS